jgi:hypothetical protein
VLAVGLSLTGARLAEAHLALTRLALARLALARLGGGRLRRALIVGHHRRGVDGGGARVRSDGQGGLAERADGSVPVGGGTCRVRADSLALILANRLGAHHELHVGTQVGLANLHDLIALLPQSARDRPATVHRDVQDRDANAEILYLGDDLGQVLLRAHHQRIGDRVVACQRGEVAVDLAFDAFAVAWPHSAEAELHTRQICQRVVLGGTAAFHDSLVPVTPKQRQPSPVTCHVPEKLQYPRVVPGDGVTVAGSVHGHRAIGQHVASVYEQRTAIHRHRPSVNARRYQRTAACVMDRAQIAGGYRLRRLRR